MLHRLKPGITFGIILVFAMLQLWLAIKRMPETKGKSLEEIEELWK
jgi:hypothetical protein